MSIPISQLDLRVSFKKNFNSLVPLKSFSMETYSAKISTVARLRSQNGLGLNWLLSC